MSLNLANPIEFMVHTLLQVGERVVEVSQQQVMTRIWDREGSPLSAFKQHYEGKKVAEIRNDSTIARCCAGITDAFATGRNSYIEYISHNNDRAGVYTFSFRILTCHPDKNFVFLVIENISSGRENILVEDKWKLAVDASGLGVWDANLENKTIFFSEKWEQLLGYSAKEISSFEDWSSKIYPEDRQIAEEKMQKYMSGELPSYSAELRYKAKDGTYKWILSRGVIISRKEDGTPLRFIGTHVGIGDRKRAEEELKQAKETFANSFNYSGIGKALIAPGGKWLEVNNTICELTGYTREELYSLHYRDITFPDDIDIDAALIVKLVKKEIPSYTIEKRYVTKDRAVLTTVITVTLICNNDGSPKYFICDIVDATKQKVTTDELKRKNNELNATSESLQSKIKQIEELNQIIAHNLRGPIGNIKMLSDGAGLFDDKQALDMIHTSSLAVMNTLEIMVETAQIKLDKNVAYHNCNIRDKVTSIISQLQGIIYQKNISIILNLDSDYISYPRVYMESILYNLISNAIKYRRSDIQCVIEIATTTINGRRHLIARDNGLGIDLDLYGDKVFQLNQVFHHGYNSKGLGLFITKVQIESLGGTITLKSKPNEGCEFDIML